MVAGRQLVSSNGSELEPLEVRGRRARRAAGGALGAAGAAGYDAVEERAGPTPDWRAKPVDRLGLEHL
jgi:hypothetical protein